MSLPLPPFNLIAELGLESLSDEKKINLLKQAATLIEERLTLRIVERFSPEQKDRFLSAVEASDSAAVQSLVDQSGINMDAAVAEEITLLRSELKGIIHG